MSPFPWLRSSRLYYAPCTNIVYTKVVKYLYRNPVNEALSMFILQGYTDEGVRLILVDHNYVATAEFLRSVM